MERGAAKIGEGDSKERGMRQPSKGNGDSIVRERGTTKQGKVG